MPGALSRIVNIVDIVVVCRNIFSYILDANRLVFLLYSDSTSVLDGQ